MLPSWRIDPLGSRDSRTPQVCWLVILAAKTQRPDQGVVMHGEPFEPPEAVVAFKPGRQFGPSACLAGLGAGVLERLAQPHGFLKDFFKVLFQWPKVVEHVDSVDLVAVAQGKLHLFIK